MSTDTEAPSVHPSRELTRDELRDRLLDAIFMTTGLFARGKREVRRGPIPEQPMRVLTALLILIEQAADAEDTSLTDQHCIKTHDLLRLLPPRKTRGTTYGGAQLGAPPAIHPDALFMALDWLAGEDLITLEEVGKRRKAHQVRLTLDYVTADAPHWEHARQVALDGVLLKRLSPAQLAILGYLAYAVDEGGAGVFAASQVEKLTGLSFKWVSKQLALTELGSEHGLRSWDVRRLDGEQVLVVQLCKPDDTEVLGIPLPRLHHSFVAAALSGEDDVRDEPASVALAPSAPADAAAPGLGGSEETDAPVLDTETPAAELPGPATGPETELKPESETTPDPASPETERRYRKRLNQLLSDAVDCKAVGDTSGAENLLQRMLAAVPGMLAPVLFAGDEVAARAAITAAYEHGDVSIGGSASPAAKDAPATRPTPAVTSRASRARQNSAAAFGEAMDHPPLQTLPTFPTEKEDLPEFDDDDMMDAPDLPTPLLAELRERFGIVEEDAEGEVEQLVAAGARS